MLFSATMPAAIVSLARTHMRHPMNIRAESVLRERDGAGDRAVHLPGPRPRQARDHRPGSCRPRTPARRSSSPAPSGRRSASPTTSPSAASTSSPLTETIFAWPGVGKWLVEAIHRRDYAAVQGGILMHGDDHHRRQPDRRLALRRDQPADPALMSPSSLVAAPRVGRLERPGAGRAPHAAARPRASSGATSAATAAR